MTEPSLRWVLASGNRGKLAEFRELMSGLDVVPQSDFSVVSPEETGDTFLENALLKARHAASETGLPAIADDSGLAVDALGGAPGVRSARFAGPDATDEENVQKLLEAMTAFPDDLRSARFCCVIVALTHPRDPVPLVGFGEWPGVIAREPIGESGFGYDPIFLDPALGLTAAELGPDRKNRISHRARALGAIREALVGRESPPTPAPG